MKKKLSEMTLEELWKLFPIFLSEYKEEWLEYYKEEEKYLMNNIPNIKRISHIGSTSLTTIYAKPIIDILIEVDNNLLNYKYLIINCGYICMNESDNRISFNKGYSEEGFKDKVYHLHLRYYKDNDELYFRDYLKENVDVAKEYESLKIKLWKEYEFNRDAYTNSKIEFVNKYTKEAKIKYKDRY